MMSNQEVAAEVAGLIANQLGELLYRQPSAEIGAPAAVDWRTQDTHGCENGVAVIDLEDGRSVKISVVVE